jgi:hypothetical protein
VPKDAKLPTPIQEWIDSVLVDGCQSINSDVPQHVVEWFRTDGLDVATQAWEEGGELGVIPWPAPFTEFSDLEVSLDLDIPLSEVTDDSRIQSIRRGLDPEGLDHLLLCVMPVTVASRSGKRGILCLIVELQGQLGPFVLECWIGSGDAMYLERKGYYLLSDISDEMILLAWRVRQERLDSGKTK